ncbi:hypothetical protein SAMN04487897_109146 [Paenibacillus sp. yr247]|uniref:hypothetical protein n=1 Tax=Paenibacillus sp. yr247 TaxID=1761880 RepID=UPI0008918962|nr:hypothetical protein [Paenibacillus sp. yr247]SDO18702.1 hypothetical protein SAMN04487897_109146 [Paenibacillus sp. yr247]
MIPQQQLCIDQTMDLVKALITNDCPFITISNSAQNEGTIVLHFSPRVRVPRVERITSESPRYERGKVYLNHFKDGIDEGNLEFALDIIETKLLTTRMISGSIHFLFADGVIQNIQTKSSMLHSDM